MPKKLIKEYTHQEAVEFVEKYMRKSKKKNNATNEQVGLTGPTHSEGDNNVKMLSDLLNITHAIIKCNQFTDRGFLLYSIVTPGYFILIWCVSKI